MLSPICPIYKVNSNKSECNMDTKDLIEKKKKEFYMIFATRIKRIINKY